MVSDGQGRVHGLVGYQASSTVDLVTNCMWTVYLLVVRIASVSDTPELVTLAG